MPRCLEPGEKFSVWLDSDLGKPEATRPTFLFRSASCREWRQLRSEINSAQGWTSVEKALSLLNSLCVGFENMTSHDGKPIAFDGSNLEEVIGNADIYELIDKISFGAADKKKSDLPASSSSEGSAETAKTESA